MDEVIFTISEVKAILTDAHDMWAAGGTKTVEDIYIELYMNKIKERTEHE